MSIKCHGMELLPVKSASRRRGNEFWNRSRFILFLCVLWDNLDIPTMSNLPKWILKSEHAHGGPVACDACRDNCKALAIAWEALEFSSQYDLVDEKCKEAMHRIEELGK